MEKLQQILILPLSNQLLVELLSAALLNGLTALGRGHDQRVDLGVVVEAVELL